MTPEFVAFQKIPRYFRDIVVTEKIDGTNAVVYIGDDGEIIAGSKSRWLAPGKQDNFGFAAWVSDNASELTSLGPGYHFGEWWGSGIQRGYGLPTGEKRFSLFNVSKWETARPLCCHVVPVLYRGPWVDPQSLLLTLSVTGSLAAPGFMRPEGIVIFHTAGRVLFKITLERDEAWKGAVSDA